MFPLKHFTFWLMPVRFCIPERETPQPEIQFSGPRGCKKICLDIKVSFENDNMRKMNGYQRNLQVKPL